VPLLFLFSLCVASLYMYVYVYTVAAGVAGDKELSLFSFIIGEPEPEYKVFT